MDDSSRRLGPTARAHEARPDWESWRRSVDYYDEGQLFWLEIDSIIREKSEGKKSLDDFCKRFHGGASGAPELRPYTFDEVVAALNENAAYDWRAHLVQRVRRVAVDPPPGLERSGWRVVYTDQEPEYLVARQRVSKFVDPHSSIGILVDAEKSTIIDVIRGTAADKAGVGPSMRIVAVNGRRYSDERLKQALAARGPLELLLENAETFRTLALDYRMYPGMMGWLRARRHHGHCGSGAGAGWGHPGAGHHGPGQEGARRRAAGRPAAGTAAAMTSAEAAPSACAGRCGFSPTS